MIGRTNAISVNSGGSGGVTTVDLPTHPASIAYNAKNQNVDIILTYSSTDLVSGVRVVYKLGAYPENPDDGEFVEAEGAAETVNVPNLTNGTTYYFRVFLYREIAIVKYFQTDIINAKCECIPRTVEVTGITPMVQAADHLVFTESGTFTLTANAGTKVVIGSAGSGQSGGFVAEHTLAEDVVDAECTLVISATRTASSSKITIGETTYDCGSTEQIVQGKWGPIGGKGGKAATGSANASDGTGAGGGGGAGSNSKYSWGLGGNLSAYGNKGGSGGKGFSGSDGSSGKGGAYGVDANKPAGGGGGGGGYAAGGGEGSIWTTTKPATNGQDGEPGTGIVVIEWD